MNLQEQDITAILNMLLVCDIREGITQVVGGS